jgi:hypothetical protein
VRYWWPLVEDIIKSPAVQKSRRTMVQELESHDEFTSLSIDATLRCCMTVMGQASYRDSAANRADAAFDDATSLRRVLSIVGRTGSVVGLVPIASENSDIVSKALEDTLSMVARNQVKYIFCDCPSTKLWSALQSSLPNLEAMSLDSVHLAIVDEYSTWSDCVCISQCYSMLEHYESYMMYFTIEPVT